MSDVQNQNDRPFPHAAARREGPASVRPITNVHRFSLPDDKPENDGLTGKEAEEKVDAAIPKDIPFLSMIELMLEDFIYEYDLSNNLTGRERLRLFGAGVRNFGFIEKAYDIALENPGFLPRGFSARMMGYNVQDLEDARQFFWILQQFLNAANELVLKCADVCFRDALRVYGNLRELSRSKVQGADVLYRTLLTFFRKPGRAKPEGAEPTQKELERDFMKLIHGHADGDIEIVNERPHFIEGVRKVVDNVHTGHAAVKENVQAEIKE